MRLSEAIELGSTILKPRDNFFFSDTAGCALEMAMAATGHNQHGLAGRWIRADEVWPWINTKPTEGFFKPDYMELIMRMFSEITLKKKSLDQLIDWVRSVEPEEILEAAHTEVANGDRAEVNT